MMKKDRNLTINELDNEILKIQEKKDAQKKYNQDLTAEFRDVFLNSPEPINVEELQSYLEKGINPNVMLAEYTLLSIALVAKCHEELVPLLLQYGANPNQANGFGETPLMIAYYTNSTKMIKLLIQNGADLKHKTKNGDDIFNFQKRNVTGLLNSINEEKVRPDLLILKEGYELMQRDKYTEVIKSSRQKD